MPSESIAGMAWIKGFIPFLQDMFRHWVGQMTGALSIVLGVFPVARPDFFSGAKGLLHNQWLWWSVSAIAFFIAARAAWDEQRKRAGNAEKQLEDAINKDRPEVFASLNFGPDPYSKTEEGERNYSFVTISNRGKSFAMHVRIDPIQIDSKLITFSELQIVNPSQNLEPSFMWAGNERDQKQWDAMIEVLRRVAEKKRDKEGRLQESTLEFDLRASWEDSRGNKFCSKSQVFYTYPEQKCRTRLGIISRVQ